MVQLGCVTAVGFVESKGNEGQHTALATTSLVLSQQLAWTAPATDTDCKQPVRKTMKTHGNRDTQQNFVCKMFHLYHPEFLSNVESPPSPPLIDTLLSYNGPR